MTIFLIVIFFLMLEKALTNVCTCQPVAVHASLVHFILSYIYWSKYKTVTFGRLGRCLNLLKYYKKTLYKQKDYAWY